MNACRDAVLRLGEFRQKPDKHRLYRDMEDLLEKYASADLGTMDLAEVMQDLTEVMHQNGHRHALQPDHAGPRTGHHEGT